MNKINKLCLLPLLLMFFAACSGGGGGGGNCGGPSGKACEAGQFCHFTDLGCGAGDLEGSCEEIPVNCQSEVTTVCSCEGLTFFNECFANAASQSVKSSGECA